MRRSLAHLMTIAVAIGSLTAATAAESPPVAGSLSVDGRVYKLAHVVAYETKSADEELVTVLASDRKLPVERIKKVLQEGDQSDDDLSLSQPFVKLRFSKSGEIQNCQGWADNGSFSTSGDLLAGALQLAGGRAVGKATLLAEEDSSFQRSFDLKFNVALGLVAAPATSAPDKPVKPAISGKFTGNGKPAKLAFVSAHRREPFDDKPSFVLLMTEKDHTRDPKPDFKASFGDFGSALIISFDEEGGIFGCQVVHAAHAKSGFSSIGKIRLAEFDLGERHVQGQLTTDGEQDAFDEQWEVDLKFAAPLPASAAKPAATTPEKPRTAGNATGNKPARSLGANPMPANPKSTAAPQARKLPWPADVSDIEYKQLVQQLVFKSPAKVQALAAELTNKLAAEGWTKDGTDLVTPKSAILRRGRGEATLTIMLKPAASGSQATVFTSGLNWDE